MVRMTWACRFDIREAKEVKKALNRSNVDFRRGLSIGVRKLGKIPPSLLLKPSVRRGERTYLNVQRVNTIGQDL